MILQQKIHIELLDLLDDVKFELTELNAQKGYTLCMNKSMKRGVHMAYVQGQKQAIDNIMTIVEEVNLRSTFPSRFTEISK